MGTWGVVFLFINMMVTVYGVLLLYSVLKEVKSRQEHHDTRLRDAMVQQLRNEDKLSVHFRTLREIREVIQSMAPPERRKTRTRATVKPRKQATKGKKRATTS